MILVTGATGFVGRALMRALEHHDIEAKPFDGRITNLTHIRENLTDVDTIVHLATAEFKGRRRAPRYRDSKFHRRDRNLYHVDVEGTRRLVQEAEKAGVNHIIYVSRLGAEKASAFPVLRAKGLAEQILQKSDVPSTIFRASTLFGRGDHYLTPIASLAIWNWPFVWLPAGGTVLLQPLWVEDLIRCIITVSDPLDLQGYRGKIYTAAGEERFHYHDLVRFVMSTAQLNRIPLPIRNRLVRFITAALFGWRRNPPINLYFLDHLRTPETASLNIIHQTFGFHPARLNQQTSYLKEPRLGRLFWR